MTETSSLIHTTNDGIKIMMSGSWGEARDENGMPTRKRRVFVEMFDDDMTPEANTTKEDNKSCSAFASGMAKYYKECKKKGLKTS